MPWIALCGTISTAPLDRTPGESELSRNQELKVGAEVLVRWGLGPAVPARVIEVWGDPPSHVRVELLLDPKDEPTILLLPPSLLTPAA